MSDDEQLMPKSPSLAILGTKPNTLLKHDSIKLPTE